MFLATIVLFLLASLIQSSLILLQQRGETLTRWWGQRAFPVYNVITLIPWTAFVVVYVALQFQPHPELSLPGPWFQVIGALLLFAGAVLSGWVAVLLGPAKLNGLRFFDPAIQYRRVPSGPFRLMKNPMYTGFFFIFLGVALWKDSLYSLAIALESIIVLNGVQAWVENQGLVHTNAGEHE